MTTTPDPNAEISVCVNCGQTIVSRFRGRWVSAEHGDVCFKSYLSDLSVLSATVQNRLHQAPRSAS